MMAETDLAFTSTNLNHAEEKRGLNWHKVCACQHGAHSFTRQQLLTWGLSYGGPLGFIIAQPCFD